MSFQYIVFAQDYRYHFTPYLGKNFMDSNYRMEDSFVAGFNFDSYFTPYLGIRTGYEKQLSVEIKEQGNDTTMHRFYLNLIAKNSDWFAGVTSYIAAGGGYEICGDNDCPGEWFTNISIGSEICITDQFSLTPEIKAVHRNRACDTGCDGLTDYVATLGATYAFGAPEVQVREKVLQQRVEVPVDRVVTKEVRVEVPVEVPMCIVPKITKDRCDNSYYIQVASAPTCPTCPQGYKDKSFLKKVKRTGYDYTVYTTTIRGGDHYSKVLIGSYRCKRDAYAKICEVKEKLGCDAFVYSKKD